MIETLTNKIYTKNNFIKIIIFILIYIYINYCLLLTKIIKPKSR